jgi:hypothetical protein
VHEDNDSSGEKNSEAARVFHRDNFSADESVRSPKTERRIVAARL